MTMSRCSRCLCRIGNVTRILRDLSRGISRDFASNTKALSSCRKTLYFPPPEHKISSGEASWEKLDAADLGWDLGPVRDYLRSQAGARPSTFVLLADGKLVDAVGFNGADPWTTRTETYSCQKSVAALLVGVASSQGFLSLDDAVRYPRLDFDSDSKRGRSDSGECQSTPSLRHALAMTMGLDRFAYSDPPGERWRYDTDAAMLSVCAALEEGVGKNLDAVARDLLFDVIGTRLRV